jgi:hypothetical protein
MAGAQAQHTSLTAYGLRRYFNITSALFSIRTESAINKYVVLDFLSALPLG